MSNIILTIGHKKLLLLTTNNSSVDVLVEKLQNSPITVHMKDYASMEKVGQLPQCLPCNDKQITTEAGDVILYQGRQLVIYYDTNSWSFTRLGKIQDVTAQSLLQILGRGDVDITLSLPK